MLQDASNASNLDDETEGAAMALVSLQTRQPPEAEVASPIDSMYGSEVDEIESSGVEEEVDELAEDSDSGCESIYSTFPSNFQFALILVLDIPTESPTRVRVHYGTSKTPFECDTVMSASHTDERISVIFRPISFIFSMGRTVKHVFTLLYKLKILHFSIFIAAEPR